MEVGIGTLLQIESISCCVSRYISPADIAAAIPAPTERGFQTTLALGLVQASHFDLIGCFENPPVRIAPLT